MDELFKEVNQLRKETGVLPNERHPSEWEELGAPKQWALAHFDTLPKGVLRAVKSTDRDPLIPANFGSRPTVLEKAFFNQANLDAIQDAILDEVLETYRYEISKQSDVSVHLLMVEVFDQQVKRFEESVYRQKNPMLRAVRTLNAFCLERAVMVILKEIKDYLLDRKHWEVNPVPELPLPTYESNRNEYPLESQPFFVEKGKTLNVKPSELASVGAWP